MLPAQDTLIGRTTPRLPQVWDFCEQTSLVAASDLYQVNGSIVAGTSHR